MFILVPDAPPPLRLLGSLIHMYSRKVHAVYYAHFTWHSRTWIRDILTGTPEFRNCKAIYRLARRSHLDSITSTKSYTPEAERERKSMDGIDANRILPDSCLEAHMYLLNVRKKEAIKYLSSLFYIWRHDMVTLYGAWDETETKRSHSALIGQILLI